MSTNIDRSLDEIIKEKRKLKKKALKQKTQQTQKKGAKQQQGRKQGNKGAAVKQNQRRRIAGKNAGQSAQLRQGTQGRKRISAGKQSGQFVQQGRGGGNQNYRKNQTQGNKGRTRGGRVAANRLKSKQTSVQKSKQIISKAKQIQQNRTLRNRQNRQTQQKDARQNIINNRRGMQVNRQNKAQNVRTFGTPRRQRRNRRGIQSPQLTVSINNPRVRLTRTPQWTQPSSQQNNQRNRRRWRGGFGANPRGMSPTEDLRISVPNNVHQPAPLKPLVRTNYYNPPVNTAMPGKTFATLDERFSSMSQSKRVRTIVVE